MMSDTIWVDREVQLPAVVEQLENAASIGVDTEFLREKTFFPKLCVLQLATPSQSWCIDTLDAGILETLTPALTRTDKPKIVHAARQDLEAYYCTAAAIIAPVFDTQIAAALTGMKPQVGYAELVSTLLEVSIAKTQTRTDWSRRPLSAAQLSYAADDVEYLHELAARLSDKLRALGREQWAAEDCAALIQQDLYDPPIERAGQRLKGLHKLDAKAIALAFAAAAWRERVARDRDLPRSWVLSDGDILQLAHSPAKTAGELQSMLRHTEIPAQEMSELFARIAAARSDAAPAFAITSDAVPSAEQKSLIDALARTVDKAAAELGIAGEILAPRAELKALAMGRGDSAALRGWRRGQIGEKLLALLPR
jgi:ribonuclease D